MPTTKTDPIIDWREVAAQRTADLHAVADERNVTFTDSEARSVVAITIREDARRALALAAALTAPTEVRRGSATTIAVAELELPSGAYLLLRRGFDVWLVPDVPNGWEYREPWRGNIKTVRWVGGPPAVAAFRRVGAPI